MAIQLNGTSQYGRVANNTNFNVTPSITVMGWVKSTSTSITTVMQRIISRYLNATVANEQYGIDIYMGNARFLVGTTTLVSTCQGTAVPTGVWTHICGTYDGTTMMIYQDGIQTGSLARSGTITSSTGALSFGADYNGTAATEYFAGSLEDLRIYNRALSQPEIETVITCRGTANMRYGLIFNLLLDEQRSGSTLAASAVIYDTGPFKMNATNIVANTTFVDGYLRKRRFS